MHFNLTDLAADITQNCAESGAAQVVLEIRETLGIDRKEFRFIAGDNGKGMSAEGLDRAMDPFVTDGVKHPGRKVGLGIPFLIQTALQSGGGWKISTAKAGCERTLRKGGIDTGGPEPVVSEAGTTVEAWFDLGNMDTPPVGDIPGLFRTVMLFTGPEEIIIKRSRLASGNGGLDYELKRTELVEVLGGDLEDVSSLVLLGKYLRSLEGEDDDSS
ncbi:MAG: ATP-binding protein [Treponema sp.]|nr:ATP-binding protein [Treponema sp.]